MFCPPVVRQYLMWIGTFTQVCSGLGGGYLAVLMASYTYLTHLAERGQRMKRVGVAESAVFLSSTVSVFVSGRLVDTLGYVPVFSIALACQVTGLVACLCPFIWSCVCV